MKHSPPIQYLPTATLDVTTGVKTQMLTGKKTIVDVKAELEWAYKWWNGRFFYEPCSQAYQNLKKLLANLNT